jgi:Fe-S cluster assembly protein SufD
VAAADLRFAAINHALAVEELHVDVPADGALALEVVFVAVAAASRHASHPVLRVRAGAGSRLALVERHVGGTEGSFVNARVLVEAGAGARVTDTRLQGLAARASHVETLELALDGGAEFAMVSIATGAATARSTAIARHVGRDSTLRWHAVSLAAGTQVNDTAVRVEHDAPGARTEQVFRGIASGRARVAFNGHMVVQGTAPGADSAQSLKCLTDGPEAEADLRPQLEIHTDAVRATHGATVGKLDEAMRFYLLSRGLDAVTAAALLKWAFVGDVVARLAPPALRREVEGTLASTLGDAVVAELIS